MDGGVCERICYLLNSTFTLFQIIVYLAGCPSSIRGGEKKKTFSNFEVKDTPPHFIMFSCVSEKKSFVNLHLNFCVFAVLYFVLVI